MLRRFLNIVDRVYRWLHQLEPAGSIFYIGLKDYKGDPLTLSDGTAIRRGDRVCFLHFNNDRVALIHKESEGYVGFLFARHVKDSLSALANRFDSDKAYDGVVALSAITWMAREGTKKMGFESYPVGGFFRLLWLRSKFYLYLFPAGEKKGAAVKIRPNALWMSRKRLFDQYLQNSLIF